MNRLATLMPKGEVCISVNGKFCSSMENFRGLRLVRKGHTIRRMMRMMSEGGRQSKERRGKEGREERRAEQEERS